MLKNRDQISIKTEKNARGEAKLYLSNLCDFEGKSPKVRMYAKAELEIGEQVNYHMHIGESETYYIISGKALYNDNGNEIEIGPGDATFTPSNTGHGIKNIGTEKLVFMALIVLD